MRTVAATAWYASGTASWIRCISSATFFTALLRCCLKMTQYLVSVWGGMGTGIPPLAVGIHSRRHSHRVRTIPLT